MMNIMRKAMCAKRHWSDWHIDKYFFKSLLFQLSVPTSVSICHFPS